ncbi:MAG: DUF1963 domain-containing protein [Ruminococcus sp.]|nr:DUF1963 domain-containing protein [Ruminococcus sp.]
MPEKHYINAVILSVKETYGKDIPSGASKMGGFPDLPPEIEYPVMTEFTEKWCNKKTDHYEKSAMQLVAQINLYELAESGADVENLLPKTGMLYIFWSGEIMELESDEYWKIEVVEPDKTATYKVILWDGDISSLRRTEPPCPYHSKYFFDEPDECFTEFAVKFDSHREYKNYKKNSGSNKFFGCPQGEICPQIDETEVNLFQFDCYDNFEGCIWKAYWIIKKSDLKNLDFSRVLIDFDMD